MNTGACRIFQNGDLNENISFGIPITAYDKTRTNSIKKSYREFTDRPLSLHTTEDTELNKPEATVGVDNELYK